MNCFVLTRTTELFLANIHRYTHPWQAWERELWGSEGVAERSSFISDMFRTFYPRPRRILPETIRQCKTKNINREKPKRRIFVESHLMQLVDMSYNFTVMLYALYDI